MLKLWIKCTVLETISTVNFDFPEKLHVKIGPGTGSEVNERETDDNMINVN